MKQRNTNQARDRGHETPQASPSAPADSMLALQGAGGGGNAATREAIAQQQLAGDVLGVRIEDGAGVLAAFESLWATGYPEAAAQAPAFIRAGGLARSHLAPFVRSPLAGSVRGYLADVESHIARESTWSSGAVSDGLGTLALGATPISAEAEIRAKMENEQVQHVGEARHTVTRGDSRGATRQTEGSVGAKSKSGVLSGGLKATRTEQEGSTGGRQVGLDVPTSTRVADLVLECELTLTHWAGTVEQQPIQVRAGRVAIAAVEGL